MAGRAELWTFTWGLITQHPLIGYGFNSFEVYASQFWTGQVESGVAAHNNYLSVLYSTGIAGMIPFVVGFLILLYRWIVTPDPPRDFWVLSALVCGYAEMDVLSSFAFVPSFLFFIVIVQEAHRNLVASAARARVNQIMNVPLASSLSCCRMGYSGRSANCFLVG